MDDTEVVPPIFPGQAPISEENYFALQILHDPYLSCPIRVVALIFAFCFAVALEAAPATLRIPLAGQAVRYERIKPVFQAREIPREQGDTLLKLLDGGRAVEAIKYAPGMAVVRIPPPRLWISVVLGDGATYQLGIGRGKRIYSLGSNTPELAPAWREVKIGNGESIYT